ncbi:MAG TPA: hypothetical protein VHV10_05185 [Ktedonobacteraceae bacterium]|jgi:hypothetical protein|nr:hypothetical protein [Ktedonobacteraceae bacterium]
MLFDKDKKVVIEYEAIRAAIVLDAIMTRMETVIEDTSIEGVCKYLILRDLGQEIVDQLVPRGEQEAFLRELLQNETILSALRKERGEKGGTSQD